MSVSEAELNKAIDAAKGIKAEEDREEAAQEAEARTEEAKETAKREIVMPSAFKNHPGAMILNSATDKLLNLPEGSAAKAEWGEAWCSLLTYYTGAVPNHPIVFVLGAGITLITIWIANRAKKTPAQTVEERRSLAPGEMAQVQKRGMIPA